VEVLDSKASGGIGHATCQPHYLLAAESYYPAFFCHPGDSPCRPSLDDLFCLAPFVWTLLGSLKTYQDLISGSSLLPKVWTLANYKLVMSDEYFPNAFKNSTIVAVAVTLAVLFTSSAAGYIFAKYQFWGKEQLFVILLSTMMVPFAVLAVPLFITAVSLKLNNTLHGLIVTGLYSTFGIFMMRQFMETIPNELIDAGRIDGASEWWIFGRLILPLSSSPLSALLVFTFLGNWDNFFWPYILLNSQRVWTLPLVVAGTKMMYSMNWPAFCAIAMFTVAPVMLLYFVAQKQFVRGIAMTGLKL
jgi:multiple sugar transport system permease protein